MTDKEDILTLISTYLNDPNDLVLKSKIDHFRGISRENNDLYLEIEQLWHMSSVAKAVDGLDSKKSSLSFQNRLLSVTGNKFNTDQFSSNKNTVLIITRWAVAAILLIGIGILGYQYLNVNTFVTKDIAAKTTDQIIPGGNKATLLLADGTKISLTDADAGDLAMESGLTITKTSDGQLVYEVRDGASQQGDDNKTNTIETPKGGTWQVKLPDGSRVWLNAQSSITYPVNFSTKMERIVELSGEAYFEIAEDKEKPFIVKTSKQALQVLGTHFNISSYNDDFIAKTTLFEGSVKVKGLVNSDFTILKPGEQSLIDASGIKIEKVDVNDAIDWKNGYFLFNNERQEIIMKKLARWYNFEVVFADSEAKDISYYGIISRSENISKILQNFEKTGGVRFEISQHKITIYKAKNSTL